MKKLSVLLVTAAAALTVSAAPAHADTPLTAPYNLQALHVADTSADLDWLRDGFSAQEVVERKVNGAWQEFTRTETGFLPLTGLTRGTVYTFRIYSIPVAGLGYSNSARSAPITFTTLSGPDTVPPVKPAAPVFSSITTTRATVSWAQTTDNVQVTGYHLQQLIGGAWSTIRTVGPTEAFQTVTGLAAGTAYTFGVIAFDARGNTSARSEPGTVTTLAHTAGLTCRVQIISYSPSFLVSTTIINTTPAPVSGWTLQFTAAPTTTITGSFGGSVTRNGTALTQTPAVYYTTLAPGSQAGIGFNGTSTAPVFTLPSSFTAAGTPCQLV
ncbi:hypothetical protein F4553_007840 [Allocatelliglobosispora scoriae]|uniref:Fibronectin type III domain-containing protein n=1 Tax=Allocatelliglobosispora scoriae TaxID=643052 RepID=A0A841C3C0_9ACTN|nr:fibronectin type III domain-containing protein [Allocatelliglobosispora scoriae]MBB5874406.1 hypothetical protein [Allocatelliglobosispora scoriae]